jgi:hypothetical protein
LELPLNLLQDRAPVRHGPGGFQNEICVTYKRMVMLIFSKVTIFRPTQLTFTPNQFYLSLKVATKTIFKSST